MRIRLAIVAVPVIVDEDKSQKLLSALSVL
jgi:hypothetical protein